MPTSPLYPGAGEAKQQLKKVQEETRALVVRERERRERRQAALVQEEEQPEEKVRVCRTVGRLRGCGWSLYASK